MVPADTSSRQYVSELRRQQAAATREKVVAAAAELFADRGYAATTMPAIARRAGVSTETVQNHGPKVELLRAATAAVSFGGDPGAPVVETELGRRLLSAATPAEAVQVSAEVLTLVNEGAHGVWMAFSEAARSDPRLESELRRLTAEIAQQNAAVLQHWHRLGWLRTDLEFAELVLRSAAIGAIELWDRVVRLDQHSREEYCDLVAGLLGDTLLARPQPADEFSR
ncbi:MAG TPA: TetR/AcrR family transcriptional regulator [Microlunatus sp.]|nr:TetR/AcrR family transcriptional regulator [Microlunatus sp.]